MSAKPATKDKDSASNQTTDEKALQKKVLKDHVTDSQKFEELDSEAEEVLENNETIVVPYRTGTRRLVPFHQSRIADRPGKDEPWKSALKVKIELDLEVEVEIYARVKGDVTIGLL